MTIALISCKSTHSIECIFLNNRNINGTYISSSFYACHIIAYNRAAKIFCFLKVFSPAMRYVYVVIKLYALAVKVNKRLITLICCWQRIPCKLSVVTICWRFCHSVVAICVSAYNQISILTYCRIRVYIRFTKLRSCIDKFHTICGTSVNIGIVARMCSCRRANSYLRYICHLNRCLYKWCFVIPVNSKRHIINSGLTVRIFYNCMYVILRCVI